MGLLNKDEWYGQFATYLRGGLACLHAAFYIIESIYLLLATTTAAATYVHRTDSMRHGSYKSQLAPCRVTPEALALIAHERDLIKMTGSGESVLHGMRRCIIPSAEDRGKGSKY